YLLPARLRDNPRLGVFGEISDSVLLTEPERGKTRVVRRMRLTCGPWPFRALAVPIVLLWGEAITARHFLRGVKRRAEALMRTTGRDQPRPLIERIKTSATRFGSSVPTSRPSAAAARSPGRQPTEVAPGVYCLVTGPRFLPSNVYFVRSGSSWALI